MRTRSKAHPFSPRFALAIAALGWIAVACSSPAIAPVAPAPLPDGPTCTFSSSCPAGQFCDLKQCTQACNTETPCAAGQVCTARGRCAASETDPGDPAATASSGVLTTDAAVIHVASDQRALDLHLMGSGQVRYRVAPTAAWLQPAALRGAFDGEAHLAIALDPAAMADQTTATLHVISTEGDVDVVVQARPNLQGAWKGSLAFEKVDASGTEVSTDLGETHLGLAIRTDGSGLRAQLDPETSVLWPAAASGPVTAAGTTQPDGSITFVFTELLDGESAAPLYPTVSPSVFRPTQIGRELTLKLSIDETGSLKGTAEERIHGLTSSPVVVEGTASFTRSAQAVVPTFEAAAATPMPADLTRGVGPAPSPSCPPAASLPECAATASEADRWRCLIDDELPLGYLLSNFYDPQNPARVPVFALPTGAAASGSTYADVSAACGQELPTDLRSDTHVAPPGGGTACINLQAMSCARYVAGTLFPDAPELSAQGSIYVARASLELFALVGNQALVQAGTDRLSSNASNSKIRSDLLDTRRAFDAGLYRFFNPQLLEELRAISPAIAQAGPIAPVVVNDRAPLRLAAQAVASSEAATRRAYEIDLEGASDVTTLRHKAQANAVLTWLQIAVLADLDARWRGSAPAIPEVTALGATVRDLDDMVTTTTPGVTPLGISSTYVPLLARSSSADVQTNFERIFAIAQTSVAASVQADATASAEEREFDHDAAVIEQTLQDDIIDVQGQLQAICGNDFLDGSGAPEDLSACGQSAGSAADAVLAVKSAALQVQSAQQALSDQYDLYASRTNAYAQIHNVQADQIAFVTKTNATILKLNIAQAAMQASADLLSAAADAADSFKDESFVGGGLHIAAGVAQAAADLLGPAQVRLQQLEDVKGLQVDQKITDIQDAEDLYEAGLQFNQLEIQVALQANEEARALNALVSLKEQVTALIGTYRTDQAALARATTLGVDPSFRIIRDANVLAADTALAQGKHDLYLAARALEYETNTSLSSITQSIFLAANGSQLDALQTCLSSAWNQWRLLVSSTNSYVTEVSLAKDVLGIGGPVTDPTTGHVQSAAEQFRHYLFDQPYAPDAAHVWPALRFGTTLSHSGLFSALVCNDRIQSVEAKLVGPGLTGTRAELQLLADGSSQLRSCAATANEDQLVSWNLRPQGQLAPATLSAGINDYDTDASPNASLLDYSVSQDTFVVAVPDATTSPANRDLDLSQLDDIVLRVTHSAIATGSATASFHPTCN